MIPPIGPGSIASIPRSAPAAAPAFETTDFRSMLDSAIQHVEGTRSHATAAVDKFLSGESEELHTAALAVQKADLEFDMFLQVRNKVVSAYQEIMRMQV